jgi:hypothetical protein
VSIKIVQNFLSTYLSAILGRRWPQDRNRHYRRKPERDFGLKPE